MLKIGWSKRDVSTNEPVSIPGQFHLRISKGVFDPLFVSCLAVENNNDVVIFLSGDFVSSGSTIDIIRQKLSLKRPDFPVLKVIFNVTHTHCGADIRSSENMDNPNVYPALKYKDFMTDMSVEAILEAYDNMEEGYIAYGYGFAAVAYNRRSSYSIDRGLEDGIKTSLQVNGHTVMYGKTDHDNFIGFEGGADHYANFMYTFNKKKELTGAIINIPCPSQNSEIEHYLSADYWHNVRELIYAKYGEIGILPQCAAAGDLAPRPLHYNKAEKRRLDLKFSDYTPDERALWPDELKRRQDIAIRICDSFDEVLEWAGKDLISDAEVVHTVKTIKLDKFFITDEQYKESVEGIDSVKNAEIPLTGDPEKDSYNKTVHETKVSRWQNIINRYVEQKTEPKMNMELHVIKIGDIAFATNAFELYNDFQHRIQARSPFTQTFIIQLTSQPEGNLGGYLATERSVQNLGYGANLYSNFVSPQGGQQLVEETLKELKKIY